MRAYWFLKPTIIMLKNAKKIKTSPHEPQLRDDSVITCAIGPAPTLIRIRLRSPEGQVKDDKSPLCTRFAHL